MARLYVAGEPCEREDEFELYLEQSGDGIDVVMRDIHEGGIQTIAYISNRGILRPHVYLASMIRFFGGGSKPALQVPDIDEKENY